MSLDLYLILTKDHTSPLKCLLRFISLYSYYSPLSLPKTPEGQKRDLLIVSALKISAKVSCLDLNLPIANSLGSTSSNPSAHGSLSLGPDSADCLYESECLGGGGGRDIIC